MVKSNLRKLCQLSVACILTTILLAASISTTATPVPQKMTAEELVAKHLESIGTAEVRAKTKSYVILGTALVTVLAGAKGTAQGGAVLASQGAKSLFAISYGNQEYPFERAGFDGKTVTVSNIQPGIRSTLGKFFMDQEMPFREGLIGGTLSTAWPLLDMSARNSKLDYLGTQKLNGRKLHVLEYKSRNNMGLKTKLFFDADTFQHVRTEYEKKIAQQMPDRPSVPQSQGDSITKLVEEFSDFKMEGGLTLPHTYKLELSILSLNKSSLQNWVFTLTKFSFNHSISDAQFDVRN